VIYDVLQTTTYDYGTPVAFGQHVLRMLPRRHVDQHILSATLEVSPMPGSRLDRTDFFGNPETHVIVDAPHSRFVASMRARVRVDPPEPLLPDLTPDWEKVRDEAYGSTALAQGSPVHFLFPSRHVPASIAIRAYAGASFSGRRPVLSAALDLMQRIHDDFTYQPGATDVTTPAEVAFAERAGVCQDYAHVMLAGLRSLGIPAAYVSGFLRTIPPVGEPRLEGADAPHAWVSVWCGEVCGWRGLDPTNAMETGEDHIVAAIGRDYTDVAPVDGIVVAAGDHTLSTAVDVTPVG
jgi:transglutaminase-like putative cysteine protease